MLRGSPAWKPQATLAEVSTSSSASSSPIVHAPKLSPTSATRSILIVTVFSNEGERGNCECRSSERPCVTDATQVPSGAVNTCFTWGDNERLWLAEQRLCRQHNGKRRRFEEG